MSLCGVSRLLQATLRANNNWSGYADQGACQELAIQEGRRGAMKDWPILPCHYLLWSLQLYPGAKRSNTDIWQNDWKGKDPWENLPGIQVILFLTGLVAHSHTKKSPVSGWGGWNKKSNVKWSSQHLGNWVYWMM